MFPFSVPLGFLRSRASRSGSSGSAAALRSGSARSLALFACILFCSSFRQLDLRSLGFLWTRPSKRGVCLFPERYVEFYCSILFACALVFVAAIACLTLRGRLPCPDRAPRVAQKVAPALALHHILPAPLLSVSALRAGPPKKLYY